MAKINWTTKAADNLNSIHDYISNDSKVYAQRFIRSLILSTKKLKTVPECGRIVPEFQKGNLRELIFQNYRIVYRFNKNSNIIEILSVIHCARDFTRAFETE